VANNSSCAPAAEGRRGRRDLVRGESAFYNHDIIAACRRGGARFSVTAPTRHRQKKGDMKLPRT